MTILLFEDKLGITAGYANIWEQLLRETGLAEQVVIKRSAWRKFSNRVQLLTRKGNRKSPGFNPDERVQKLLSTWVASEIAEFKPTVCVCMDMALFFLMNPNWDQATPDNMRGGVYNVHGIPFVCSLPISAWHSKKSDKDIARLNEGFTDKEEWEQEHGGDESDTENIGAVWVEPVSVPYGKFVLRADLAKASRLHYKRIKELEEQ